MTALSELLADRGWQLTGSDAQIGEPSRVDSRILRVHSGHDAAHLTAGTDLVAHSPAVRECNPEREAARSIGIPDFSYVELLSLLVNQRAGICIAGTHGKTTTTAMAAAILRESGFEPSAAVGGELIQYDRSGWSGDGEHFVVEACEYRRHFLEFEPKLAAILNVEADHFDCFADIQQTIAAFEEFAERIVPDGLLVLNNDSAGANRIAAASRAKVSTFSLLDDAEWTVSELPTSGLPNRFRVLHNGRPFCDVALHLPGRHNIENALAAAAVAHGCGVEADAIGEALSSFQGVRRRFEFVCEHRGMTLIDDYAHHPTAVKSTLAAARQAYGDRRLVAAFQPHQVSRTRALMDEFAGAFADADEVILVPIFAAREDSGVAHETLRELEALIEKNGRSVRVLPSLDHLKATVDDSGRHADVWLMMGAGDIFRVPHEFARQVRRDHAG